jgi:hypothetical protein
MRVILPIFSGDASAARLRSAALTSLDVALLGVITCNSLRRLRGGLNVQHRAAPFWIATAAICAGLVLVALHSARSYELSDPIASGPRLGVTVSAMPDRRRDIREAARRLEGMLRQECRH